MVFKPFTTLARQSISRHFINGYAQSVVAATQSSYASQTLPIKFGHSNAPAKFQNTFGGAHSGRTAPGKDGSGSDAVNSFYAAQSSLDDKEDRKYLFSKKILWSKAQHQQQQKQLLGNPPEPVAELAPSKSRASSFASATAEEIEVEIEAADLKEAESAIADEAIESAAEESPKEESQPQCAESLVDVLLAEPEPSPATKDFNLQLQALRDQGRWEEVTVLFRHMMEQGVPANTTTYNLLLDSVISLHPRHVSQVIDVYSAMLREKLVPTTSTYSVLINFLAARALESLDVADNIERDAQRFGMKLPWKTAAVDEMKKEGAMDYALGLFYDSTLVRKDRVFPTFVYETLVEACSKYRRVDDMLKVYTHMEVLGVPPTSEIIRSMIRGFGRTGSVQAAVETYNGWLRLSLSRDPGLMNERYMVYRDLIKAYMESGDTAGALSFLEKVIDVSHEPARLEWLKQAVIEGFVAQGDIQSARKWTAQLSIERTSNDWLAKLMTRVADQDELDFSRQIYNTINFETTTIHPNTDHITSSHHQQLAMDAFALCQESGLAISLRNKRLDLARDLWGDLTNSDKSSGPSVAALLAFVDSLFKRGFKNEALVHINLHSNRLAQRFGANLSSTELTHAFQYLIKSLGESGILDFELGLEISGFSLQYCDDIHPDTALEVVQLIDHGRIMYLEPGQLSLALQLQYKVMVAFPDRISEFADSFEAMFNVALKYDFLIVGPLSHILEQGTAMLATIKPELQETWTKHTEDIRRAVALRTEMQRLASPMVVPLPAQIPASYPMSASPSASPMPIIGSQENAMDPYADKFNHKASNAIDSLIDRNRPVEFTELRAIYRSARKHGMTPRMATLTKLVAWVAHMWTACTRGENDDWMRACEDFVEEIIRNAKVDLPAKLEFVASRDGWASLLDAAVAAQLNMRRREKADSYHNDMKAMGLAPSANTFGLYIVALKGSRQSRDEATDAVKIFTAAMKEGVRPTSFLFNAVIGTLAKARRVDDCLAFYCSMRSQGLSPTSVTFGTLINALTRVGDEQLAVELFNEMEIQPNYKPRPAPYNSIMQFFINSKHDRARVLEFYNRMRKRGIKPTAHTYKLLIEAYATLDQPDLVTAQNLLEEMEGSGVQVQAVHHAVLIHAKGCALHDADGAISHFTDIMNQGFRPDTALYQALLEVLVANHRVQDTPRWVAHMERNRIEMTPYIANCLIHGWAIINRIDSSREIYDSLGGNGRANRREPSTYEAMARAYLTVNDRAGAQGVLAEMQTRGYPYMVVHKVSELIPASDAPML